MHSRRPLRVDRRLARSTSGGFPQVMRSCVMSSGHATVLLWNFRCLERFAVRAGNFEGRPWRPIW